MTTKRLITVGLLTAAGLAIILSGFGILSALLSVSSLAALWWCFIREPEGKEELPGPPVSCCHYLGDLEKEDKKHKQ